MIFLSRTYYFTEYWNSLGYVNSRNIGKRQRDLHPSMISRISLSSASADNPGQTGELLPYGTKGLVFKEGNETTEEQEEYYRYINRYVEENNIPGIRYKSDEDVIPLLDKVTEMMSTMIKERIYIPAGTPLIGELADTDHVEIHMEEPLPKSKKK